MEEPLVKLVRNENVLSNLIKMVAYQAESDLVRLVAPHYRRADDEGRPETERTGGPASNAACGGCGKPQDDQVGFQPYWGKPAVRNEPRGWRKRGQDLMAICYNARKGRYSGSHCSKPVAPPLYSTNGFVPEDSPMFTPMFTVSNIHYELSVQTRNRIMPTQRVHTGTRLVILLAVMLAGWPHLAQAEHRESPRYASATRLPFEKTLPGPINGYEVMKARSLGREYILDVLPLSEKGFTLECRVGRSCGADMAWLMIRDVTTQRGLAVSLAYSGNWRIVVRPDGSNTLVRVVTPPEHLEPFDTINGLPIPGALYAEFTGHWDNGAQPITRFVRAKLLRSLNDDWPWVMYNSWLDEEGTKPTAKALINTASVVADLGCELFVIDAGWFGQVANWPKALGDWHVHRERFPDGIEPVAEEVRRLGMKFGMWIEIECAYPDSPVGKARPEWLIKDRVDVHPTALAWILATPKLWLGQLLRSIEL
jgi:hypothetical protein